MHYRPSKIPHELLDLLQVHQQNQVCMIQLHLDCNFSKIQILLISSNVMNILVICKRTFPTEKTCIIDMLSYLIYVKKYENTFYNMVRAKRKS